MFTDNDPLHASKWMQLHFTLMNVFPFFLYFSLHVLCFALYLLRTCAWMFIVCSWKGKGENIWDRWTHEGGHIFNNDTGDIACDSYHKYKEDVQLLKDIGVSIFNFAIYLICVVSFSWLKILQTKKLASLWFWGIGQYISPISCVCFKRSILTSENNAHLFVQHNM